MKAPGTDALNWQIAAEQMAVIIEIRDLLRVLVDHKTHDEDSIIAKADAIRQRRAAKRST